jgi:hypothetical protein
MTNVIQFRAPQEDKIGFDQLLEGLKENTEQLIYVGKTKDGKMFLGHSPLEVNDLIVMYYHVQKYIDYLLESPVELEEDNVH